jgi:hypothetical protein
MEVHHHSHSSRKKWAHYFWEFLMLFLAVFTGFLAENQREHIIEHKREKQFMRSLIEDLRKDTASMHAVLEYVDYLISGMDSLRQAVYSIGSNDSATIKTYVYSRQYLRPIGIDFTDRTSSQLKFAGGMRLIRNERISDSIIQYWAQTETIKFIQDRGLSFTNEAIGFRHRILDSRYFLEGDYETEHFPIRDNPVLLVRDPGILSEYANHIYNSQQLLKQSLRRTYKTQIKNAERLIEAIMEEYHLK